MSGRLISSEINGSQIEEGVGRRCARSDCGDGGGQLRVHAP